MAESVKARAIVARQPLDKGKWSLEEVRTRSHLEADEVLVEMVGSGICHTDILLGTFKEDNELARYPRILGHEGSGHVRAVGSAVKNLSEGDPVLLSFSFCNECYACSAGHRSYCKDFNDINFVGREGAFTDSKGEQVCGSFFGQSSFASFSVVRESSIVNVKGLVNDEKELALFSPLGCGLQTGAGTVLNASGAGEKDVLLVSGLGGVGLAAVMGAKIAGCRIVVGVDRVKNRLDRAKELGATHVINTDELGGKSIADAIKAVTEGVGPTISIETTGAPVLIQAVIEACRPRGQVLQVGSAPSEFRLEIRAFTFMVAGKSYRGVIEGEAYPPDFVPKLIQYYREGKFPLEKLVKLMDAKDFEQGLHEMHTGETIKPVLLW